MDLYDYMNINDLKSVAKENWIDIPRLRGCRLMKDEEKIVLDKETYDYIKGIAFSDWVEGFPRYTINPYHFRYSRWTGRLEKYYKDTETGSIRWDRIHGKKRKNLKYLIKKQTRACEKAIDTFNKYVGRSDVLHVHARIGSDNWAYYGGPELEKQPWFIKKVDDPWDRTYCDIFCKIKEEK